MQKPFCGVEHQMLVGLRVIEEVRYLELDLKKKKKALFVKIRFKRN